MEFDVIDFIKSQSQSSSQVDSSVILGIGDDAAVINLKANRQLVVSTDTLVGGVHFDNSATPAQIGHKALAVSLSDLAAMGATPKWCTLNLTLPKIDMQWLAPFISGLLKLATKYNVSLVGGDTTAGALSITVTVFGEAIAGQYLTRSNAKRGDLIAVSGEIGSAAFALDNKKSNLAAALHVPEPQLKISQQIKSFARACIDISDGLLADLGHICKQSNLGATILLEQIPVNKQLKDSSPNWSNYVLAGGDDYQLCFTFSPDNLAKLPANCTIIGQMGCGTAVKVLSNNQEIQFKHTGFIHFNS
ncbi:Thiamine-monophosphate kinase [hydrothermal vent metagenome]|uniref:Thiamine-monophosphate kinase n=1 Tax=hydrothermal vent metagenome TaxID=652676 RepID=A0A3B0US06_9ZZZZ